MLSLPYESREKPYHISFLRPHMVTMENKILSSLEVGVLGAPKLVLSLYFLVRASVAPPCFLCESDTSPFVLQTPES